ncbi:MAG: hypothetical protein R2824_26465 [Saprospiraceae bacterium]|nr:hypothetical protein [Lewinella sp.]
MKKPIITFILIWSLGVGVFTQNNADFDPFGAQVRANINLAENRLTVIEVNGITPNSVIRKLDLSISFGDLILNYELTEPENKKQFYLLAPSLRLNNRELYLSYYDDLQEVLDTIRGGGHHRIVWMNPIEQQGGHNIDGNMEFTLTVYRSKFSYDCSNKPSFSSNQKLPYYLVAGVGALTIGAGQIFRLQKNDAYDRYVNASSIEVHQKQWDEANNKNDIYWALTLAGAAIIATDAILFVVRTKRYNNKRKEYQRFCPEAQRPDQTLHMRPILNSPVPGAALGAVGLSVSLTF